MSVALVEESPMRTIAQGRRTDRDLDLVEALRLREPTAAERLVAAYADRAYRLAVGITRNAQDAEEVVQDACWSVIRNIDTFRGESAFGSWFYRIVANAAYAKTRTRRGRARDLSLDEVLPFFDEEGHHATAMIDWSSSVNDPAVQSEIRDALSAAIGELPDLYRTVMILRDVEGLSHHTIATALGVTVASVKTRVHRARLFVRKKLGDVLAADQSPCS